MTTNILELIAERKGKLVSLEIEPPKKGDHPDKLREWLRPLVELGVGYVDVTYHPQAASEDAETGVRTPIGNNKQGTIGVAGMIQSEFCPAVPHVICTSFNRSETDEFLSHLPYLSISNILAIRGDLQKNEHGERLPYQKEPKGFKYALDLIRQAAEYGWFKAIGAATYPEGHPDVRGIKEPLDALLWDRTKIEAGANFLVTQMFFDWEKYVRHRDNLANEGVEVPIIPGVKPLTIYRHLKSLPQMFGCSIPAELRASVERFHGDKAAIRKEGVEWCVRQCEKLREEGAPSIHLYAARGARNEAVQIVDALQ